MKIKNKRRKDFIAILVILLVSISLGYAFLTTNLRINGFADFFHAEWSIYFDNVQINSNSVSIPVNGSPATIDPTDLTKITFNVSLDKPGDFYEFTADVINDGSLDAMLQFIKVNINLNPCTGFGCEAPSVIHFTITHLDGTDLNHGELLAADSSITYRIRLEYSSDIAEDELLVDDIDIKCSVELVFVQADESAYPYDNYSYLYSTTGNTVRAGSPVSLLGTTYNSDDVSELLTNKVFLRHIVSDGKVRSSDVGFEFSDGNVYYLSGLTTSYSAGSLSNTSLITTLAEISSNWSCDSSNQTIHSSFQGDGLGSNPVLYHHFCYDDDYRIEYYSDYYGDPYNAATYNNNYCYSDLYTGVAACNIGG